LKGDQVIDRFDAKVCEKLRFYVYLYIDPRTSQPFYIGKGRGNRVFAHLQDDSDCEKVTAIKELKDLGLRPVIEILKYGLNEEEALLVESTAIDLVDVEKLTNQCRGHGSGMRGRVEDIAVELAARPAKIVDPVVLINVAKAFHYGMSPQALYDATRSAWKVNPEGRIRHARFALSVYRGVIREVYEIATWVCGGSTMRSTDADGRHEDIPGRWEFVGRVADEEVRRKYLGCAADSLVGNQNPILYVNCE
jgi:hypothetical protein